MAIDFLEETEEKPQIDFIPEEEPKPDLSQVKISPYEAEKLKPGYRPMTTMGPVNPEEVLTIPQVVLNAPGAVVEPIMRDVEEIAADFLGRTGINPSARAGQQMAKIPAIPNLTPGGLALRIVAPELAKGMERGQSEFLSGMTTPGQATTIPLIGGKLVQALFALQAAGATPEAIRSITEAKTADEQGIALAKAGANLGMAYMLGKGLVSAPPGATPPPITRPPLTAPGRALPMPKGATPPRPEPVAAPERLSPDQAAIQAERMSQEATAAVEPAVAPPTEAAAKPVVQPNAVKEIALEAQKEAGWNTKWPFVPADFYNKTFRDAIESDTSISPAEKNQMFSAAEKLLNVKLDRNKPAAEPPVESAGKPTIDAENAWMEPAFGKYQLLSRKDMQVLVTKDPTNPELVRATYLVNGEPTGHQLFRSLSDLDQAINNSVKIPESGKVSDIPLDDYVRLRTTLYGDTKEQAVRNWQHYKEVSAKEASELGVSKPKPPTEAPGEATPAASPAAAVGEVSATPGAVAPAQPPAISQATTPTKGMQTGKPVGKLTAADWDTMVGSIEEFPVPRNATLDFDSVRVSNEGSRTGAKKTFKGQIVPAQASWVVTLKLDGESVHEFSFGSTREGGKRKAEALAKQLESKLQQPAPAPEAKPAAKEPWQMTRAEFAAYSAGAGPNDPIVSSAVRGQSGSIYTGPLHGQAFEKAKAAKDEPSIGYDRETNVGYVTKSGKFISAQVAENRHANLSGESLAAGKPATGKAPTDFDPDHRRAIREALDAGKPVPPEVLADYPDLAKPAEGKTEPPIVGMGGAVASEFQPAKPMSTSVKDAALDRDRADRGLPPMMDPIRKSDPELYAQMQNVLDNDWQAADKLIARWKTKPFLPTDVDTMVLLHRRVDLKNEYAKADREYLESNKEGRTEDAQTAKAVRDTMAERLDELDEVLGRGEQAMGTMMGRAFRARQLVMREDYTLDELVRDRRTRTGNDNISEAEMAELRKIADQWQEVAKQEEAKFKEADAQRIKEQADRIAAQAERDALKAKLPNSYVIKIAEEIVASWDKRADAARARLREKMARTSAGVDPTILVDVAEIGLSHLGHVGLDFVKWSEAMRKDIGDWAEDYLKPAWEKVKAAADAEIASRKGTATVKQVKKAMGPKANVLTKVRNKLSKMDAESLEKMDLHWDARKIARYFWVNGIREPLKLVDAVHELMREFIPALTRDEVMDAMSGYGRYTKLATDEVSVGLRDVYGQLQQEAKLRDLSLKPPTLKPTGMERRTPSDAERRKIKQVEAKKRDVNYQPVGSDQLRSAFQATERRLANKIKDLQFEIDKREKIVKKKPNPVTNDKIAAMREYLTALKEIHDDVFKPAELTDAQRLDLWKERAQKWIDNWTEKLELGDVLPKKRKPDPRLDKEALALRYKKHQIHNAVLEKRLQWEKQGMNKAQRLGSALVNALRFSFFMMTGGELSAVLRQGKLSALGHPIIASKSLKPMLDSLMSEKKQFEINEEIQTRENAPNYQRDKLQFTEFGQRLSTMEEMTMFRISDKLLNMPVAKYGFRFLASFQRAYTTYLNTLRANLYDALTEKYGNDPVMGAQIADFINVTTGRGSASLGKTLGPGFNVVLFAPRYTMSRIQFLTGHPLWHGDMRSRKMVIREYGRILAGAAAMYALGAAAGGKIEKDPRSGSGWLISFGNKKIDPLAGLTQFTRLISRVTTGWNKNQRGRLVPIREGQKYLPTTTSGKPSFGGMTSASAIGDFARRKLAPVPGTVVSGLTGSYPGGDKFKLQDTLIQHSVPITYRDIYNTMTKDENIPANLALSILMFFGETVQVWDDDKSRNPR